MITRMTYTETTIPELEIEYSGHAVLDESWHCENECNPFSRLYYVKSGSGYLKHKNVITELKGGSVYLVPAECEFSYGCKELEKIFFHISASTAEKYELLSGLEGIYSMPFPEKDYSELLRCCFSDRHMDLLKVKMILYKTIIDFYDEYNFEKTAVKKYSDTVAKAMTYIQKNARINLKVSTISENIFISESNLRKAFKSETGISVGKYIDDLVFTLAKKMLAGQKLSIKEISRNLGFCDQFYFSRSFKHRYHKTPSEYRNETRI